MEPKLSVTEIHRRAIREKYDLTNTLPAAEIPARLCAFIMQLARDNDYEPMVDLRFTPFRITFPNDEYIELRDGTLHKV
jgi:hypothetical protein